MELDVHLTNDVEEPRLQLSDAAASSIPVIDEAQQNTHASTEVYKSDIKSQCHTNEAAACHLSEDSNQVTKTEDTISPSISCGLYDPVVTDHDPVLELDDSDRPSRPQTEVFSTQQFIEPPELFLTNSPPDRPLNVELLSPYRTFFTEPLNVPISISSIIINSNYTDVFGKGGEEAVVETKFKLPISKQYDPAINIRSKSEKMGVNFTGERLKDIKLIEDTVERDLELEERIAKEVIFKAQMKRNLLKEELLKQEIDIENIEKTALNVVDQSIETAISVAEEINREVDKELRTHLLKDLEYQSKYNKDPTFSSEEIETTILKKENDSKADETESKVTEQVEGFKLLDEHTKAEEEMRLCTKLTTIEVDTGRKTIVFEKFTDARKIGQKKEIVEITGEDSKSVVEGGTIDIKEQPMYKAHTSQDARGTVISTKGIASRLQAEQKAYSMGLQTVSNIKGALRSTCHFNLLLRHFFIRLKDVMIGLSRFVSTQSTFSSRRSQIKNVKEIDTIFKNSKIEDIKIEHKNDEPQIKQHNGIAKQHRIEIQPSDSCVKQDIKEAHKFGKKIVCDTEDIKDNLDVEEISKKRKLSGAKMAQLSMKESEELTQKMDAVISEFETKAIKEDKYIRQHIVNRIRSRSRSEIEKEVMRDSDPLEWLAKLDSRRSCQEKSKVVSTNKGYFSLSESRELKKNECKHESKHIKMYESLPSKQMYKATVTYETKPSHQTYVAIVESHVYTNKHAILEDQIAETSETTSAQRAEETTLEAVLLENVAMKSSIVHEKHDKMDTGNSQALSATSAESEATLQITKDISEYTKEIVQNDLKQHAAEVIVKALQECVVQEKHEVMEQIMDVHISPIEENLYLSATREELPIIAVAESTETISSESKHELFQEQKISTEQALIAVEEDFRTTAIQKSELNLEMNSITDTEPRISKQQAASKQESLAVTIAGSTETSADALKIDFFDTPEMKPKTAFATAEEYKISAVHTDQVNLETVEENTAVLKLNKDKASLKQESLAIFVAATTEISDNVPKLDVVKPQQLKPKKATVSTEDCFKMIAIQDAALNLEIAEENKTESKVKQMHASLKQEFLPIAVATSTETSDDIPKTDIFELQPIKCQKASVSAEEKYKATAVQASQVNLEMAEQNTAELKVSQKQASVKQESLAVVIATSTEIPGDFPQVDTFEPVVTKPSTALVSTVGDYKTSAVQVAQHNLEGFEENTAEPKEKQMQASLKQESLTVAVAATIETSADIFKADIFVAQPIESKKALVSAEENYKTTAVQTSQVNLEMAEQNTAEFKVSQKQASVKQESLAIAIAACTEIPGDVPQVDTFQPVEMKPSTASISAVGGYKTSAIQVTQLNFEALEENTADSKEKQMQASISQESLTVAVAASVETSADIPKADIFVAQPIKSKKASVSAEENYKATAVQVSQVNLEMAEQNTAEFKVSQKQASVKQESLAVVIATSTEIPDDFPQVDTFEPVTTKPSIALVSAVGDYKTSAVQVAQHNLEGFTENTAASKEKKMQASIKQESLTVAVAATIETSADIPKADIFAAQPIKSKKALVSAEENYKRTAVQASQVNLEMAEQNTAEFKVSQKQASVKQESLAVAIAASTEIPGNVPQVDTFKPHEMKPLTALISTVGDYKTSAIQAAQLNFEALEKNTADSKVKQMQASIKQESLTVAVAASTESSADIFKADIFVAQPIKPQKALVSAEENYKTTALQDSQVNLEIAEQNTAEFKVSQKKATVKHGSLAVAIAASSETPGDVLKVDTFEPREIKPSTALVSAVGDNRTSAVKVVQFNLGAFEENATESKLKKQAMVKQKRVFVDTESTETCAFLKVHKRKSQKAPLFEDYSSSTVEISELDTENDKDELPELNINIEEAIVHENVLNVADSLGVNNTEVQEFIDHSTEGNYNKTIGVREVKVTDEYESLQITKKEVLDGDQSFKTAESDTIKNRRKNQTTRSKKQSITQEINATREVQATQLSSKSLKSVEKLHIRTDLAQQRIVETQASVQIDENNNTPSPSTVPPTPLTDEYIFKLEAPLPSREGSPIPRDCTPDDEDPHIVKKNLIPQVEISIEQIVYDPPLPSPPEDKVSPVYTKPGLKGGAGKVYKEESRQIEIKSPLTVTVIDETSIGDYKEKLRFDKPEHVKEQDFTKSEQISTKIVHVKAVPEEIIIIEVKSAVTNNYDENESEIEGKEKKDSKIEEEWQRIYKQVEDNNVHVNGLSSNINKNEIIIESQETTGRDHQEKIFELSDNGDQTTKNSAIDVDTEIKHESINANENISPMVSMIHENITTELLESNCSDSSNLRTKVLESKPSATKSKSYEINTEGQDLGTSDLETNSATHIELEPEINSAEFKSEITEEKVPSPQIYFAEIKTEFIELENSEPEVKFVEFEIAADSTVSSENLIEANETADKSDVLIGFNSVQLSPGPLEEEIREQNTVKVQETTINQESKTMCGTENNDSVKKEENIEESEISSEAHAITQSSDHMDNNVDAVDSNKIIPIVESLRHSEVIRALNEEFEERSKKEKKGEERKRSTFMQKPQRTVPNQKFDMEKKTYKVKIVKQPKPKVAPDYKSEDSEGPLTSESSLSGSNLPVEIDQLRVTEEVPKVLEAVNSLLKEEISVPDTEEKAVEETEMKGESEQNKLAEQLVQSVRSMVDPNATLEQQVAQMQAQLAALAQLPNVIQQTIDMVTQQLTQMNEEIKKQAEERRTLHQIKLKPIPRGVGKARPMFGPLHPEQRPLFLPAGWKWRSKEAYDEQLIAETLHSQSELLQGKVIGSSCESAPSPCDERINFKKYEKPPVSLDHLERSDVYKVVHNVEQAPVKRVELRAPVIAEADYRERCRSATPSKERIEELEP